MGMDYHLQLYFKDGNETRLIEGSFGSNEQDRLSLDALFRNYDVFEILMGNITGSVQDFRGMVDVHSVNDLIANHGKFSEQCRANDKKNPSREYLFGHNTITLKEFNELVKIYQTGLRYIKKHRELSLDDEEIVIDYQNDNCSVKQYVDRFDEMVSIDDKKQFAIAAITRLFNNASCVESFYEHQAYYDSMREDLEGIVYCLELLQSRVTALYDLWYNTIYSPYNNKEVEDVADKLFMVFSFDH